MNSGNFFLNVYLPIILVETHGGSLNLRCQPFILSKHFTHVRNIDFTFCFVRKDTETNSLIQTLLISIIHMVAIIMLV